MRKFWLVCLAGLFLTLTGLGLGWLIWGMRSGSEGTILSREEVATYFGDFGLRQYDKIVKYGIRSDGLLRVGDRAPDLELHQLDGTTVRISDYYEDKPLVLTFGSYTWPPFRASLDRIETMREEFKDLANFLIIYIKEAHPEDEWQMETNVKEGLQYRQPRSMQERIQLAQTFVNEMDVQTTTLVDDITNPANACYAAWPERIYVIDRAGSVVYKGKMGPDGFNPDEANDFLKDYFSNSQSGG